MPTLPLYGRLHGAGVSGSGLLVVIALVLMLSPFTHSGCLWVRFHKPRNAPRLSCSRNFVAKWTVRLLESETLSYVEEVGDDISWWTVSVRHRPGVAQADI
jgi:hypothetical protein